MLESAPPTMAEMLADGLNALSTGPQHIEQPATLAGDIDAHVFARQRIWHKDRARGRVRNPIALGAQADDIKVARLIHRVTPQAEILRCPIRP